MSAKGRWLHRGSWPRLVRSGARLVRTRTTWHALWVARQRGPGERQQRFSIVGCGVVQHSLHQLAEQPPHDRSRAQPELADQVVASDHQLARRQWAARQLPPHAGAKLVKTTPLRL